MKVRTVIAAVVVALLLTGCSDLDTGPEKPTFGDGSTAPGDADSDVEGLAAAVRAAGIRDCPVAHDEPATGNDALPDLELACLGSDDTLELSRLRGPLVLNFWASWCKPCREELPLLARLDEETGDDLAVIGIDLQDSDPEAAVALAVASGVTYPQLADPQARARGPMRVVGLPQTVFVDARGTIVATERVPFTSYEQLTEAVSTHLEVGP